MDIHKQTGQHAPHNGPSSIPKTELEFDLNYSLIVVQALKHRHRGPSPTGVEPDKLCEAGTVSTLREFLQEEGD